MTWKISIDGDGVVSKMLNIPEKSDLKEPKAPRGTKVNEMLNARPSGDFVRIAAAASILKEFYCGVITKDGVSLRVRDDVALARAKAAAALKAKGE